jgi:KUP system potassium uptake protein
MLAAILSFIFVLWRFGKENQWAAEAEDRFQSSHLLISTADGKVRFTSAFGSGTVSKVDGVGIYFDKIGNFLPIVFAQFIRKFSARPQIIIFFHMRPISTPSIPESERYIIQRTAIPGCYRITARHGYMDGIVKPELGRVLVEQLTLFITREIGSESSSASSKEHTPEVQAELDVVHKAADAQVVRIPGAIFF